MNYYNGIHNLTITNQGNGNYLATISSQNLNMSIPMYQVDLSGNVLVSSFCRNVQNMDMNGFCSRVNFSVDRRTVVIPGFPNFISTDPLPRTPVPLPPPVPPPGTPVPLPPPVPPPRTPVPISVSFLDTLFNGASADRNAGSGTIASLRLRTSAASRQLQRLSNTFITISSGTPETAKIFRGPVNSKGIAASLFTSPAGIQITFSANIPNQTYSRTTANNFVARIPNVIVGFRVVDQPSFIKYISFDIVATKFTSQSVPEFTIDNFRIYQATVG